MDQSRSSRLCSNEMCRRINKHITHVNTAAMFIAKLINIYYYDKHDTVIMIVTFFFIFNLLKEYKILENKSERVMS